jgi:hypothetical protein
MSRAPAKTASQLQEEKDSAEWDALRKDAPAYCKTIMDFMGSCQPEERAKLEVNFSDMFLSGHPTIYWARGLRLLSNKITRLMEEHATMERNSLKSQADLSTLHKEFNAYKEGVRDSGNTPRSRDGDDGWVMSPWGPVPRRSTRW